MVDGTFKALNFAEGGSPSMRRGMDDAMDEANLGRRLRAVRHARGQTLAEVSTLSGLSRSFLSMLETGKTNVSAEKLQRLVRVYDLTLDDVLPSETSKGLAQIVRAGDGARLTGFRGGIEARLLVRDMQRRIQPVRLVLPPGAEHRNDEGHAGEEFLMVLEGTVVFELDDVPAERLEVGDSAFYPSALAHAYRNDGDAPAVLLTISVPNTWLHS
jgi:transcriptional regulator with XRE-family HTH domain